MSSSLRRFSLARKVRTTFRELDQLPQVFRLVWQASHWWTIAWVALLAGQGLLPVVTVLLTRTLVDGLVTVAGKGISWEAIAPVALPAGAMALILLLTELLQGLASWVRTAQSEQLRDHIAELIHHKATAVDYAVYESSEFYDRLTRATSDASGQSLAVLENSGSALQNTLTLLAMGTILLPYGVWLPFVLFASTLPAFYVMLRLNRRNHRWWEETTLDRRRLQYYEIALTHMMMAAEVRLFNLGPFFRDAYRQIRRRLYRGQMQLVRQQSVGRLFAGVIALLCSGGALVWVGRQVLLGTMTLGDLALFYQAFSRGQGLMRAVLTNLGQIYTSSLYLNNLLDFLRLQPSITDPVHPKPVPSRIQQGIRLRGVTFAYPGSDRPVLKQFNLTLPAGKVIAVVGDNGAGKSTLVKLLCRFYDPQSGSIELDGTDLRDFAVQDWRQMIAVLFQDYTPYHLTAIDNIRLGDLASDPTQQQLEQAAKDAGIHDRIIRLPQGYASQLGKAFPGGTDLSGGEWQRLALARAFLRRAPLIILDEPTSAMDPWAEADWLDRFRTLAEGRTAVVITHRFTLAMRADVIHVMRAGEIVESGTHQQLIEKNGLYAQSWRSQMETQPIPLA